MSAQLGGHIEVLEFDDLRVRVEQVTDAETEARMDLARDVFDLDESVVEDDFRWGARVSVGLDRLVEDFSLDCSPTTTAASTARCTSGSAPGMILGASLLTARGIPAVGRVRAAHVAGDAHHGPARRAAARSPSCRR